MIDEFCGGECRFCTFDIRYSYFICGLVWSLVDNEKNLAFSYILAFLNEDVCDHSAYLRPDFHGLDSAYGGRVFCCESDVAESDFQSLVGGLTFLG